MRVTVSEGGEDGGTVEIDDLGTRNCSSNLLTGPKMGDPIPLDGDSLEYLAIERTNAAIGEDSLWRDDDQIRNIRSYTWTFESGPDR